MNYRNILHRGSVGGSCPLLCVFIGNCVEAAREDSHGSHLILLVSLKLSRGSFLSEELERDRDRLVTSLPSRYLRSSSREPGPQCSSPPAKLRSWMVM